MEGCLSMGGYSSMAFMGGYLSMGGCLTFINSWGWIHLLLIYKSLIHENIAWFYLSMRAQSSKQYTKPHTTHQITYNIFNLHSIYIQPTFYTFHMNFSTPTYILRTPSWAKNSHIHWILKIIFKNRVFAKNLHSLIHPEFPRIFERERERGRVLHREGGGLSKSLPGDLLYGFL